MSGGAKEARLREAAEWLQRLHDAPDDEGITDQWRAWCQSDPDNLDAFDKMLEAWGAFDTPEVRVAAARLRQPATSVLSRIRSAWPGWSEARFAAVAAAAVLVVALGFLVHVLGLGLIGRGDVVTTEAAERGSQILADGSRVVLGARTRISTRYTEHERAVIVEYGEAFFDVVKDPRRPFTVQTGNVRVTAVGTAFSVRRTSGRTVVAVSEGVVRVAPTRDSGERGGSLKQHAVHQVQLGAGEQVSFSQEADRLSIVRVNPKSLSARLDGQLSFVEEPLASVIADIHRYSPRRIIIADRALQQRTFTGTVYPNRLDDWLRALPSVFPLNVERDGEAVLLVARTPAPETEISK